jgi:hypothetical protein
VYKTNLSRGGERIELHIKLNKPKNEIHASGGGVDINFKVEVLKDGTVGLTYNDEERTNEQAAERILKPFFFPELIERD